MPKPFVSVIMPIRNEADFIAQSLGAVLQQDYPNFEVIVADGMSTDDTRHVIQQISQQYPSINVEIIDNPARVVPTGFNRALQVAKGTVIVRVDGHTIIEPNYVSTCVETLERTGAACVGGRMDAIGRTPMGQTIALATSSAFGVGGARFHYSLQEEWVDTVYLGAWKRSIFDHYGGFDEEFVRNQDDEFNYRLRENGHKILLNPSITSRYYNRSSLRTVAKQYFQYGYYKVRVMQKHPAQMRPRQFAPPLFVIGLMGGAILAPLSSIILWLWLSIIGLYVGVNLLVSIRIARTVGWRHLVLLPITFTTLHMSYGLGFLNGLIAFRKRWGKRGK